MWWLGSITEWFYLPTPVNPVSHHSTISDTSLNKTHGICLLNYRKYQGAQREGSLNSNALQIGTFTSSLKLSS